MLVQDSGDVLKAAVAPLERSPDLVVAVDREGRVVARNRAAEDPPADQLREVVDHVVRTGEPRSFEWGVHGAGGVRGWYAAVATPIEAGGAVAGVLVSSRDITELKRAEQRLRRSEQMMVDTQGVAHLGTWEWDVTQPTATWSDELFRIYGLTPETYTPSYEAYLTKVHPDDRQRVIDATNRVFHEHVPYSHDERISRPDGSIRYLHTWAFPVLDHGGTLVKLVGVCQDITDRKLAELELHNLNAELEARVARRTDELATALKDLESFNSIISHDLRAPLAVIQMGIDMIAREPSTSTVTVMLERMQRSVHNMSALLRDLLEFARVGESALQPVEVDVSALCAEILAEHQHAAPDRDVATSIAPGLRVFADRTMLRVVLVNLLGNAWKYTATTQAARIEVGQVQRADGRALCVKDNGIGFDMSESERLFRPFSRLSNAEEFKGTGVGLATVQRIVERHGGTIRAESAIGSGATFFVVLPDSAWRS